MISNINTDRCYNELEDKLLSAYQEIQLSGQVRNGKYCRLAEDELKKITGRKHARLFPSGTISITVALLSWQIINQTVATTPYSYVASANQPALLNRLNFYDINASGVLDVNERILGDAVIPVNLYGNCCDYDTLYKNINATTKVIVDSAQGLGSMYKDQPEGSRGDVAVFSFAVNKPVPTAGTHGALVWDDDAMTDHIIAVANNGKMSRNAPIVNYGVNGEPFEIQASQIYYGLLKYKKWQNRRTQISTYYSNELQNLPVELVTPGEWCTSNNHKFVLLSDKRNDLNSFLHTNDIESQLNYTDNLANYFSKQSYNLPNTEKFCSKCITIPNSQWLTDAEVEHVVATVKKFYES